MRSALGTNGSTRRWREIRQRILRRDRNTCQYCGAYARTVDHRLSRTAGGGDHPSNLVACCVRCQTPGNRPVFRGPMKGHAAAVPDPPPHSSLPVIRGTMSKVSS